MQVAACDSATGGLACTTSKQLTAFLDFFLGQVAFFVGYMCVGSTYVCWFFVWCVFVCACVRFYFADLLFLSDGKRVCEGVPMLPLTFWIDMMLFIHFLGNQII